VIVEFDNPKYSPVSCPKCGQKMREALIVGLLEPIITNLTLTELTYTICRNGINRARELVKKLLDLLKSNMGKSGFNVDLNKI
jgi:uncharacterized protein (UPF0212 family)